MVMLKAAGYVRVSTPGQAQEGESLSTQRKAIKDYCKAQRWRLVDIYADEGVSGGSVKGRLGLERVFEGAEKGLFNVVVVHRLSRLGRNARDLLNNVDRLDKFGIGFRSIKESIDFSSAYGKAMLTMLAAIAELEREIIKETMLENRIERARRGVPTAGRLPFARSYDRETGKWTLDEEKAALLKQAAQEFLAGGSMRDISEKLRKEYGLPLSYNSLINVLTERSGEKWEVIFNGHEPIVYSVPRILEDETIEAIKQRLAHNRRANRVDVKKYVLSGYVRCAECGKMLTGQTQKRASKDFEYYRHPGGKYEPCKAMSALSAPRLEQAVFGAIFENTYDEAGFRKAIEENFPDEHKIQKLTKLIATKEKALKRVTKDLDKLVDLVLRGSLRPKTVKKREDELYRTKERLVDELDELRGKLKTMPNREQLLQAGEDIRAKLLRFYDPKALGKLKGRGGRPDRVPTPRQVKVGLRDYFGTMDRLEEMSYDEKRELLAALFPVGVDEDGHRYGVYVKKLKERAFELVINGLSFGAIERLESNIKPIKQV
ncbi:MAG: recombinase family protein [Deltaproteobacteria bacterium]|nr:recombinase family protein [Deltaproteobacteria bacterium]